MFLGLLRSVADLPFFVVPMRNFGQFFLVVGVLLWACCLLISCNCFLLGNSGMCRVSSLGHNRKRHGIPDRWARHPTTRDASRRSSFPRRSLETWAGVENGSSFAHILCLVLLAPRPRRRSISDSLPTSSVFRQQTRKLYTHARTCMLHT